MRHCEALVIIIRSKCDLANSLLNFTFSITLIDLRKEPSSHFSVEERLASALNIQASKSILVANKRPGILCSYCNKGYIFTTKNKKAPTIIRCFIH
ncbi:hypothetical protein MA795_000151 [Vibrio vulnificus]|nr:hypothetical protein [Vibrio vulnificus]